MAQDTTSDSYSDQLLRLLEAHRTVNFMDEASEGLMNEESYLAEVSKKTDIFLRKLDKANLDPRTLPGGNELMFRQKKSMAFLHVRDTLNKCSPEPEVDERLERYFSAYGVTAEEEDITDTSNCNKDAVPGFKNLESFSRMLKGISEQTLNEKFAADGAKYMYRQSIVQNAKALWQLDWQMGEYHKKCRDLAYLDFYKSCQKKHVDEICSQNSKNVCDDETRKMVENAHRLAGKNSERGLSR